MEAVIFMGLQASGKSSFYREKFVDTHIRLNLDMLKTRHREHILFNACLAAKQPVVIDNTNPAKSDYAPRSLRIASDTSYLLKNTDLLLLGITFTPALKNVSNATVNEKVNLKFP